MRKRNIALYLEDIKTSINKIERYAKGMSFAKFIKDDKTSDAIIRNLEIIGEAAKNIHKRLKSNYAGIPWREIIGMRNKVIHEYFGVDKEILWKTITDDIPALKRKIQEIKL